MITTALKTSLTTAGCTLVLYEAPALANVMADQSNPADIIGIVIEPNVINLVPRGNGVHEEYPPILVEVLKQVKPEDSAENNEATLNELLTICKVFIYNIIRSGVYHKVPAVPATKVLESRYDANVIGWSMALTLKPITNAENC